MKLKAMNKKVRFRSFYEDNFVMTTTAMNEK